MADFLLELFSEEIPARMQEDAITHLATALEKGLGFDTPVARTFSTPRRLAVLMEKLPEKQADISTELKGPKVGAPEAALAGFLKKTGLNKEQLEERDGVYFARIEEKGKPTAEVIKTLVEKTLKEFPWPKSMRWGSGETAWVRPLHSIVCLFDGKVVPVEFAGVKAGNKTYGHRFLAPAAITITDAKKYESLLEKAFVIAKRETRRSIIQQQAKNAADSMELSLLQDDKLLEEVVGLVEYPAVLLGKIDDTFMDLPPEVLTMVMRAHQKYMALKNKDGLLSPYFLITSNLQTADGGAAIIEGNQRVLRARFADGRFFWDQDRKTPLSQFAEGLKSVTYHAKLGSVADKVKRVVALADELTTYVKADKEQVTRAAQLCKADLVSGMVGEFAELQGIMGRYYAQVQNEPDAVADAIRDHYKPQGPSDAVPTAPVSICVALADKLDTLVSMFAIGEKPTGSKDPFALRRAALGVIRIVLENNLRVPLKPLLDGIPLKDIALHRAHDKLVKQTEAKLHDPQRIGKYLTVNETACSDIPDDAAAQIIDGLLEFFIDRLIVQLRESGIRHDVIKAVVAGGDDDIVRIKARAEALQTFLGSEDGKNLLAGYKRAANILSIEEKKDKAAYVARELDASALKEPAEQALTSVLAEVNSAEQTLLATEDYAGAMKLLASLRQPVDQFFEKIMVNADDKNIRANRLRLLATIRDSMNALADFSLIEG